MNKNRMKMVLEDIDTLSPENFDPKYWGGTQRCIIGHHAICHPESGLIISASGILYYGNHDGMHAVSTYLDISIWDCEDLFGSDPKTLSGIKKELEKYIKEH